MFISSRFRPASKRARPTTRLAVERLENRDCPSCGDQLFVASWDVGNVLQYDVDSACYVDTFADKLPSAPYSPYGMVFGPHDGDLYLSTGEAGGPDRRRGVLRFDGRTGDFIEEFTKGGNLESTRGMIFGPDGNIYVGDRKRLVAEGRIAKYDGHTGEYLGDFVPWLSGGLKQPTWLVFGPSNRGPGQLDLYVSNGQNQNILRFHGDTGAPLGEFVASGTGGLQSPMGLSFGPDGNLYVSVASYLSREPKVLRFQGWGGPSPGALIDAFIPSYSNDGRHLPFGLLFGPDANDDGHQDLYISDADVNTGATNGRKGSVKRFDGVTGSYIDTLVPEGDHGLQHVGSITFRNTDPVTLAYMGGEHLTAVSLPAVPTNERLDAKRAAPLLAEAIARWRSAGVDTSSLHGIELQIADLGGTTLGLASGNTIWLDDNAAGEPLTKTITIEVKGDSKKEGNETFYLDLFGLSSNALFTKNRGLGTILNDD